MSKATGLALPPAPGSTTLFFGPGMERLVDLEAPADFIGKKALEEIKARRVTRKLVGIELSGDAIEVELSSFWPVFAGGRQVGPVTDAIHSPRLERNIGYAWVPIAGRSGNRGGGAWARWNPSCPGRQPAVH